MRRVARVLAVLLVVALPGCVPTAPVAAAGGSVPGRAGTRGSESVKTRAGTRGSESVKTRVRDRPAPARPSWTGGRSAGSASS
jgi:hypothetical protein